MKIQARPKQTLQVNIEGGGTHEVPLPGSMSPEELKTFSLAWKSPDANDRTIWLIDFFAKYLGEDMDLLVAQDIAELGRAWDTAEPSAGESQA